MSRTSLILIAATAALTGLAWVDALYLPLVGLGPIVAGVAAGAAGAPPRLAAVPWFAAGMITLILDQAINGEDAAFHAVVAIFSAVVALGCAVLARAVAARRRPATAG